MKRFVIGILSALLVMPPLVFSQDTSGPGLDSIVPNQISPKDGEEEVDSIEEIIRSLSLEQRIAQLMFVTLEGALDPNDTDRTLLRDLPPGGVLIPSLLNPAASVHYTSLLRSVPTERESGVPLLIAANLFEAESAKREKKAGFSRFPTPLTIAAAGSNRYTEEFAAELAQQTGVMGFNMHLGPSLGLSSALSDAKPSLDQFGDSPNFVASIGQTFETAFSEGDVLWCPTGFPGGDSNRSKKGPAVLLTPRPHLDEHDLMPYIAAIEGGAQMLHVANTLVPTLDSSRGPASLSRAVMHDLLRTELGFEGLVLAGPMDAQGLVAKQTSQQAAQQALEAGADMILWDKSGSRVAIAILYLARAVEVGALSESLINDRLRRVLEFKEKNGLLERALPTDKAVAKLTKDAAKSTATYNIERRAITLLKNDGPLLPLTNPESMPIGVTGVSGVLELQGALQEFIVPINRQRIPNAKHLKRIQQFEIERVIRRAEGIGTAVCVFTEEIKPGSQERLLRELKKLGARVVAVLVGHPSMASRFTEADAILLVYSSSEVTFDSMRAVADILVGNGPVELLNATVDLEVAVDEAIPLNINHVARTPVGSLPLALEGAFASGQRVQFVPTLALDKVTWDFGDGRSAKGPEVEHAYREPGHYRMKATVVSKNGDSVEASYSVVVRGKE